MKKPLVFIVLLWTLLCAGMTLWAIAPAHSHGPQGGAYVTETAYALPPAAGARPSVQMPQQHQATPARNAHAPVAVPVPLRPWEADPSYQQELNMLVRESALRQRQYRQRAEADISRIEVQRVESVNSHLASMERLNNRKNTSYTDYSTLASRHNAREADYRARLSQARTTLELNQLREQNDLQRRIRALDDSYARREPYRSQMAGK